MEGEEDRIDVLTGLPTFHELPGALREPAAAIFLDVDGLRVVNHDLGHLAGDEVLRRLGTWLQEESEALRGRVFRVAGDEFLLLLPGRTLEEAAGVAERLVRICPTLSWPSGAVTVSAVVFRADVRLPGKLRDVLESFAEALYRREMACGRLYGNVVTVESPVDGVT